MHPSDRPLPASLQPEQAYPAELYATVHDGTEGDIDFYRRVCFGARRVLELGCGAGRVTEALVGDGLEVVGIDIDGQLLEASKKRVPGARFVQADMRDFDLGETFDRVICPFNGIYCLLSAEEQIAAFRAARKHLAPGGMFVFDGYAADAFHEGVPEVDADEEDFVKQIEAAGTQWRVFEASCWDTRKQRIDATYTHIAADSRPEVRATIPQRYLRGEEVAGLLEEAGLQLFVLHGGFDQVAYDEDASHLIVTAINAAEA